MVKSMTGYGRAEETVNGCTITVELRSVNNRYLDCNIRLPRLYLFAEEAMKARIQNAISRGKVDVFVTLDNAGAEKVQVSVNKPVADGYYAALKQLAADYDLEGDISVSLLSRFPDVLLAEKAEEDVEQMAKDICSVLDRALADFDQMRSREGQRLKDDVLSRARTIEDKVALVERLESSLGMEHDKNYMDPAILTAVNEARSGNKPKVSWTMLFKPPYLSRTIVSYSMFSAALVFWYVVMVYAPTILTGKGFQMSSSVLMGGLMMAIGAVAGMVCGHMIEKYGRKPMYIILALLTAGCSILLTMVESLNAWLIVGTALAFFGNAIFSICKLYIAEQYPTELRGTGAGLGEAVSRICGGVLAAYFIAFLIASGNQHAVFWFLAICYLVSTALLAIWGQETMGKSVDATGSSSGK